MPSAVQFEPAAPVARLTLGTSTSGSVELSDVWAWVLTVAIVLFLGLDGGGYTIAAYGETGMAVWWTILMISLVGLLPARRFGRLTVAAGTLLLGFVGWTALAMTWSISRARSFEDLAQVVSYLGVFGLALLVHGERRRALRATVGGLATGIVLIALFALAARLWPGLFPASRQTGEFLSGTRARLSWPLDYWNALAALMVFGLPALLGLACSAQTIRAQALAAAAVPVLALASALTLSRDGLLAGGITVLAFYLFAPNRIPKLVPGCVCGLGSAVVIAAAFHRRAVQQALSGPHEHAEAASLLVVVLLVCLGVALLQTAVGLSYRGSRLRSLRVTVRWARWLTAASLATLVALALAAGAPHHLAHAWKGFKNPQATAGQNSVRRLGTTSGEGRYQYWKVAIEATRGHLFTGSGPNTFQLLWLPRAPFQSYVENAHSLYIETLAEEGVIGLLLLVAFFLAVLGAGVRCLVRSPASERTLAASLVAAMVGFLVFAAFDWIWQVAVVPVAFMLAAAALLAPEGNGDRDAGIPLRVRSARRNRARAVVTILGALSLVAIVIPLATSNELSASQTAAGRGNLAVALTDARRAVNVEPNSAAANLQVALVLEQDHALSAATTAARQAVADEPANWADWLTLSRLEVEDGHARAAVADYKRARSLNPRSSLFSQ